MRCLVTGGSGFLGAALVRALVKGGHQVVAVGRNPDFLASTLGVEAARGDLHDAQSLENAAHGAQRCFHLAARVELEGGREAFWRDNVIGTDNVLAACAKAGVERVVHASSIAAVVGDFDLDGADESIGYSPPLNLYMETKAESERRALAADRPGGTRVVALRPGFVWGPEDWHGLLGPMCRAARRGRMTTFGTGENIFPTSYVHNVADAFVAASDADVAACGKAYFVVDEPCWPSERFLWALLEAAGVSVQPRRIPYALAYNAAAALELAWRALARPGMPKLTRAMVAGLGRIARFSNERARTVLGWRPAVSIAEGLEELAAWVRAQGGIEKVRETKRAERKARGAA